MKSLTLREIEIEVNRLAAVIGCPREELPTFGSSRDFAHPHVEVDQAGYHYAVIERGTEQERRTTGDASELFYWIFESVTAEMAYRYELENRVGDRDCRRIAFRKQEELLARLDPEWGEAQRLRHEEILRAHPFDDLAGLRADYCGELRKKGLSEEEIERRAFERYPGGM